MSVATTFATALSTSILRAERSAVLSAEIAQLQCAVSALDELLYPGFGFVELIGCLAQELYAFFKQSEACVEVEPVAFELGHDLLEPLEVGFERHGLNIEWRALIDVGLLYYVEYFASLK